MLWMFISAAIAVWILQTVLGLWQFRRFSRHVKELRGKGRVAIGKAKGRVVAGAVILLCIDADCQIIRGELLEGVTIFARCRPFAALDGCNLLALDESRCRQRGLTKQQTKAALSARRDYIAYQEIKRGSAAEVRQSPGVASPL